MRVAPLIVVLSSALVFTCRFLPADDAPPLKVTSDGGAGCANADAATPEVYSFFGDATKVLSKINDVHVDLPKRKIYVLLVEGPESADVFLYEKAGENKVDLTRWTGKSAADLRTEIEKNIVSNRGIHCIGEQTKSIVLKRTENELRRDASVDAPATVKAAVSHSLQNLGGKFVRLTLFLLC